MSPRPSGSGPSQVNDPEDDALRKATIVTLTPLRGPSARAGLFQATLFAPTGSRSAMVELAMNAAPVAYREPLAFTRLGRALGMRVVEAAALRRLSLQELAPALAKDVAAAAIAKDARVQNDGRVDAVVYARTLDPRWTAVPFDPSHGREAATWELWASVASPAQGEDPELLRDYVETIVLDYLTANVARRNALRVGNRILLADNGTAFPPHPEKSTLDKMLRRLRGVERFPRGLRDALSKLDRARAAALLTPGPFEDWLVTPRMLVELDERRAALLTLIEARVQDRGVESVLCL